MEREERKPGQYAPPVKSRPVHCLECGQFYESSEMRWEWHKWVCKFSPKCGGYGYELYIFDRDDPRLEGPLDDFVGKGEWDPFVPFVPTDWHERVKCRVCNETYFKGELHLDSASDMYCCRKWPKCPGTGIEIVWLD